MGTLSILAGYASRTHTEVYAPVNYRHPDQCRLLVFPEGSRERRIYSYQAVQYCTTETADWGFHVLELPDGRFGMYWIYVHPDGQLDVRDFKGAPSETYPPDEVRILGRAFQFIPDLSDPRGERFELIRGPARVSRGDATRPLVNILN